MKKTIAFSLLLIACFLSFRIAGSAFAGSCYCAGMGKTQSCPGLSCPAFSWYDYCYDHSPTANPYVKDIKNESDCTALQDTINNGTAGVFAYNKGSYKDFQCWFSATDYCTSPFITNGIKYTLSAKECSTSADCTGYGGSNNFCGEEAKPGLSPELTHNKFCFFDPDAMAAYVGTPRVTGLFGGSSDLKAPTLEIRIPGVNLTAVKNTIDNQGFIHLPWIGEYITGVYYFLLGVSSIVAVVMIILSGIRIVVSGGGEEMTAAYHRIGQIITGLVILWGSYLILNTVNPSLTQFKALKIQYIPPLPSTEPRSDDDSGSASSTSKFCSDPNLKITDLSKVSTSLADEYAQAAAALTPEKVQMYKNAVASVPGTTVPWEMLATIHFMEAGMKRGGSILNGGTPCNTANDGDLLSWCSECANPTITNDLICGVKKLMKKSGGGQLGPNNVDLDKLTFCKYNGCFTCPDAHPYVTANFDAAHSQIPKQMHDCVPINCKSSATSDYTTNPPQKGGGCTITIFSSNDHPNIGLTNYCLLNQSKTADCKISQSDGKVTFKYNSNKYDPQSNPCGSWTYQTRAGALGIYSEILQLERAGKITP